MKILVKRTGALGDVIEATPIMARLRAENPDAIIDIDSQYAQVFVGNPKVNNTLPISAPYDRIIDLDGAFERAMRKLHPIDAYSEVAFGDHATPHRLTLWQSHRHLPTLPPRMIVVHAARSWPIRTLPWPWWQSLINLLNEKNFNVVLTGTRQDHYGFSNAPNFSDMLPLAGQAALIAKAQAFVCSESGPMIMAQATDTPVIALLTMVPPEHVTHECKGGFHPIRAEIPCVGCAAEQPAETTYFDCKFGHRKCVTMFDAAQVANLVSEVAIDPAT